MSPIPGVGFQAPLTKSSFDPSLASDPDQQDISALTFPTRKLVYETFQLAFPDTWLANTPLGSKVTPTALQDAGYVLLDGTSWWRPSGHPTLDTSGFYQPLSVDDPFGNTTTVTWHASKLFPIEITDALGHETEATYDLEAVAAVTLTDPNGHEQHVALDALGRPTKTWVRSGDGTEGDTATDPTTTLTYTWPTATVPGSVRTVQREHHHLGGLPNVRAQESVAYADGGGNVVLAKAKAWPAPGTSTPRWIGSGRTLLNNKGKPVKQYEPFFTATDAYEDEATIVQVGVSPTLHYDPVGRQIQVDHPDGTREWVDFDGWQQSTYDRIDTVGGSDWEADRTGSSDPVVQRTLTASQAHANTPSHAYLDVQGRPFRTEETFAGGRRRRGTPRWWPTTSRATRCR